MIRWLLRLFVLSLGLTAALSFYIRLVPNDPSIWHLDPAAAGFAPAAHWAVFCPGADSRYAMTPINPADGLTRFEAVALASKRTQRFAGSLEQGRITWITRSALMGYPDFTTLGFRAFPSGLQPCLIARQRFGDFDWGVNEARLSGWVQSAFGLLEPPPRVWN